MDIRIRKYASADCAKEHPVTRNGMALTNFVMEK